MSFKHRLPQLWVEPSATTLSWHWIMDMPWVWWLQHLRLVWSW